MDNFFSQKENRFLGSLALLMLLIALGAYASYTFKQSQYLYAGPTVISVTGEAEVMAVPDIGQFSFSVRGEGDDAAVARSQAAEVSNAALAYLAAAGVAESDVKTVNYYLNPKYRYEQRPCPVGSWCPGESVPDGYEAQQTIEVKVRDLDQVGELLAGLSEFEVQNLSGLQFTIEDDSVLEAEARAAAIADAQAKSGPLAEALGVQIVRMTSFYEDEIYRPYYGNDMMRSESMAMEASVVPDMPRGEQTVRSKVTLMFEVK